jgi:hypothetical protein
MHPLLRPRTITPLTAVLTVLFSAIVAPYVAILSFLVW